MTPAEELGIYIGTKVVVIEGGLFTKDSVLELCEDDMSSCPKFRLLEGDVSDAWVGHTELYFDLSKVKKIEDAINTKDLYSNVAGQGIVCGGTHISRCIKKKDNEDHYTIYYKENMLMAKGCVKHSDIPALVAALLDIYDGNVKEEELPF